MPDAPGSTDLSDDETEDDLSSYQDQSLATEYFTNISITVDRLYALSFRVRNPKMRTGLSRALAYTEVDRETGVDLIQAYKERDIRHLVELFRVWRGQDLEGHFLVRGWQEPMCTGDNNSNTGKSGKPNMIIIQATTAHASARPSDPSAATNLDPGASLDIESAGSLDSFLATAKNMDDSLQAPPPPKLAGDSAEFECHYCYTMCAEVTAKPQAWRRHIMRDLRPYVCTFRHCKDPDQQYDTFTEWVTHESSSHGVRVADLRTCLICAQQNQTTHHVASHLRRIACFAFPRWADADKGSKEAIGQTDSLDSDPIQSSARSEGSDTDDEWTQATKTVYLQLWILDATHVQLHPQDHAESICTSHLRMTYKFDQSTTFRFADPNGNLIPLDFESLYDNMVIHVQFGSSVYKGSYSPQRPQARTNAVIPEPELAYPGQLEHEVVLDSRYIVQAPEYFVPGAVFSILWHENDARGPSHPSQTLEQGSQFRGRFGQPIYSTIRRLVVVKHFDQASWCFAISTYGGRGVAKPGVDPSKHAIVYLRNTRPFTGDREPTMHKAPLEIEAEYPEEHLNSMSRLNFGKIYTVEHNVKILPIGRIVEADMSRFFDYARSELSL
ncbi:uncharacterized protein DSM5745_05773 [Aspergillus mulundensis]|uniref:Polycomb protein VEFS-Box domain-containing protein n=1 Tax=Aspergillus mulundensis TaxID=1810919 RepID=A0A3D8RYL7_9EURO|nr:hypothetical protein DSM5745_05773 [Aspergillus mulundensis]RDW78921.1 hypothetical protein DSM5745_05773 [Aspergillus mulundensis]